MLFMYLIIYGNLLLLAVAKDLGKKVSIGLATCNLVFYVISFLKNVFTEAATAIEKADNVIISTVWLVLAVITVLMTIAKYVDKTSRNTK